MMCYSQDNQNDQKLHLKSSNNHDSFLQVLWDTSYEYVYVPSLEIVYRFTFTSSFVEKEHWQNGNAIFYTSVTC